MKTEDRTLGEAVFGVQIAWWEFVETCKDTREGRWLLRLLGWLARHPRLARILAWCGDR